MYGRKSEIEDVLLQVYKIIDLQESSIPYLNPVKININNNYNIINF